LPNADKVIISSEKFVEYLLHPVKSKGKAIAFEQALGYNLSNYGELIEDIRKNLTKYEAKYKGDNGYGQKYEVFMELNGKNEKVASVLTSWIIEHETGNTRLTSAYVKRRRKSC
jgi:hypothetical protein